MHPDSTVCEEVSYFRAVHSSFSSDVSYPDWFLDEMDIDSDSEREHSWASDV